MSQTDIRRYVATALWLAALVLAFAGSSWRMHDIHASSEELLSQRVSCVADELAALLAVPGWNLDVSVARPLVFAAMRDPELYAVKIAKGDSLLEAQRRGLSGELEPWDGVLLERTVQAISPITSDSGEVGTVEVYWRADKVYDAVQSANVQEVLRFLLTGFLATLCYVLYRSSCGELVGFSHIVRELWQWLAALLQKLWRSLRSRFGEAAGQEHDKNCLGQDARRSLSQAHIQSPLIFRALFVHTFAHAPEMLSRFLAEENVEALKHLVSLIEQAAPYLGSQDLHKTACAASEALCRSDKLYGCEVEACIIALENLLKAQQGQR